MWTLVVIAGAGAVAATFAHGFVVAGERVLEWLFGAARPAEAALGTPHVVVFAVVVAAVTVSAGVAKLSRRAGSGRTGLHHVKLALDGDPLDAGALRPSLRATLVRAAGTFASSVGLTSIGRETAMIETGGAIGGTVAHRLRLGPTVAVAGVTAAFTAAYTAPVAALAYVDDHLHVRDNRRAIFHAVCGAAVGYVTAALLWERHTPIPGPDQVGAGLVVTALVVVAPAALAARGLFELRRRVEAHRLTFAGWAWVAAALVSAGSVAVARSAAGNGMNGLTLAAADPVLWAAVGLAVFRVVGMLSALACGVPGGVILPTMAVAGGWGLLAILAVEATGIDLPGSRWDGMILATAAGLATGLRTPWMAAVLVPELVGDYRLVPLTTAIVLAAIAIDRVVDRATGQMPSRASRPSVRPGWSPIRRQASSTPGMKLDRS